VSPNDLESLVRRVIRGELVRQRQLDILDDWSYERPDDPDGDENLLRDALVAGQEYRASTEGWLSWEEFEPDIERAEAAGGSLQDVTPPLQETKCKGRFTKFDLFGWMMRTSTWTWLGAGIAFT
jgi:hypothetical protein